MNYFETEEGQKRLTQAIDLMKRGLILVNLPPVDVGELWYEKICDERNVMSLKESIITENDSVKTEHAERKAFLLLMEYIANQLMKT